MCKIIACVSLDGKLNNDLAPIWDIPEEIDHCLSLTKDNIIIISSDKYNTIDQKYLNDKIVYVMYEKETEGFVTLNSHTQLEHVSKLNVPSCDNCTVHHFADKDEILDHIYSNYKDKQIYVIGDQKIYNDFIHSCKKCYITFVNNMYPGYTHGEFPIDYLFENFKIVNDSSWTTSVNGLKYKFTEYKLN